MSTSVVVVDDDHLVCASLVAILGAAVEVDVVGVAHDGASAIEVVRRLRPDVVLLDLRLPDLDGTTVTERLVAARVPSRIVLLTAFDVDASVLAAMRAGACGFLLKSTPPNDLVELVRVAARGHTVLSPEAVRHLLAGPAQAGDLRQAARERLAGLTGRERDVLAGVADGRSNAEIAAWLGLTEATVKGYVSNVLEKAGCANRTQAGLLAYQARD